MANNQPFKIKNGLNARRYLQTNGSGVQNNASDFGSAYYTNTTVALGSGQPGLGNISTARGNVHFKPDGTKMFLADDTNHYFREYDLGTAWDITTAVYSQLLNFSGQLSTANAPIGSWVNAAGTKVYIAGNTNYVYEYELSTAWDTSTGVYARNAYLGSYPTVYGIAFNTTGNKFYQVQISSNYVIWEYDVSTPFVINSISSTGRSFTLPSGQYLGFFWSLVDDNIFYVSDNTNRVISKYQVTAGDISTATLLSSFSTSSTGNALAGIYVRSDEEFIYKHNYSDDVYEFSAAIQTNSIDLSSGSLFEFTLNQPSTLTFTNPPASGKALTFMIKVNNSGGNTITWPSSVKWDGGTAPQASTTNEVYTLITTDGGTTYYGKKAGENIS